MSRALITGATGFIGHHVAAQLVAQGHSIACLVRRTSNRQRLESLHPDFVVGDVNDQDAVRRALRDVDVVYHVAGATKAMRPQELHRINEAGARMVARCCAELDRPPTLMLVSSLAAAGPSPKEQPRTEADLPTPVSHYGRSKRAGELAVIEYASRLPITIVRPPIVLGEGDHDGFAMYSAIAKLGLHVVPGFSDDKTSVVHAQDLANALIQLATRGRRVTADQTNSDGIYFVAEDHIPTYGELGRMIGQALGRQRVFVMRLPKFAIWGAAGMNQTVSMIRRRPAYLSLDKAREATAGSWTCSAESVCRDIGFCPARPFQQRLVDTVQWYIDHGWMKKPKTFDS